MLWWGLGRVLARLPHSIGQVWCVCASCRARLSCDFVTSSSAAMRFLCLCTTGGCLRAAGLLSSLLWCSVCEAGVGAPALSCSTALFPSHSSHSVSTGALTSSCSVEQRCGVWWLEAQSYAALYVLTVCTSTAGCFCRCYLHVQRLCCAVVPSLQGVGVFHQGVRSRCVGGYEEGRFGLWQAGLGVLNCTNAPKCAALSWWWWHCLSVRPVVV